MSSKVLSLETPVTAVRKLVLELDAGSMSVATLRVKPDRRQHHLDQPPALERRSAGQSLYREKPASN